jgi:hypothetical protein
LIAGNEIEEYLSRKDHVQSFSVYFNDTIQSNTSAPPFLSPDGPRFLSSHKYTAYHEGYQTKGTSKEQLLSFGG